MSTIDPQKWLPDVVQCRYLPQREMLQLCEMLYHRLIKTPSMVSLQAPITVCGDIHGQFYDLMHLIETAGDPKDTKYVFLGDYVDRGYYSLETLTYLFLILACYPENVTLLRGNHETRRVSLQYGFYEECQVKYGHSSVWNACCKVFDLLPVAALIDERVFCVHGGLSPDLRRISALKYIDRNVEVNTHGVLCDLLWSDPDEMDYGWAVNARGAGYLDSDLQREVVYFDAVPNTAERVPERVVAPYFLYISLRLPPTATTIGNIVQRFGPAPPHFVPPMEWPDYTRPVVVSRKTGRAGPGKRSGHRVFVTDDYLYLVGGYNAMETHDGSATFRDVWRMNLLTNQWTPVRLVGQFADTMASFSLTFVPHERHSKFYVYGGTGFPFGESVSNTLYECTLERDDVVRIVALPVDGDEEPPAIYGQSTAFRYDSLGRLCIYIIGGTKGHDYSMAVFEFVVHNGCATCRRLSRTADEPTARYRHESFHHDGKLYSMGGCNSAFFCGLTVFNLETNKFEELKTEADPVRLYPLTRKGHALVKHGHRIAIFGGTVRVVEFDDDDDEEIEVAHQVERVLDDVWIYDLRANRWTKSKHTLPSGVFFHSADVTNAGQVFTYGGCKSAVPEPRRTKKVVSFLLQPPRLDLFCARLFVLRYPRHFVGTAGIAPSTPFNVVRRTLLTADEYERERQRNEETGGN
ncbi:Serine/threonine-protein phosphatase [Aphelenchoides fujianensis]|nr:Serine/threonine-protein phosphatase [Aphelenchoides fujianensis]